MKLADFEYSAFISYESHCKRSKTLAKRLWKYLQGYTLPASVDAKVYRETKIGKVFYDKEYSLQHDYLAKLLDTLKNSAYLIVISSIPKSKRTPAHSTEQDQSNDYRYPNAAIKLFLGYDVDFKKAEDEKLTEQQIAEIRSNPELRERLMKRIIPFVIDDDLPEDVDPHAWKERLPHNLLPFIDGEFHKHINRTSQLDYVKCKSTAADILLGNTSSESGKASPLYLYEHRQHVRSTKVRKAMRFALFCLIGCMAAYSDFLWIELSKLFNQVSVRACTDYVETSDNIYPTGHIEDQPLGRLSGFYLLDKKGDKLQELCSFRIHDYWTWAALRPVRIHVDENSPQYQNRYYGRNKELVRWVRVDQDHYLVTTVQGSGIHELNAGIERYFDYYDGCVTMETLIEPLSKSPSYFRVERSPEGYVNKRYFLDQRGLSMYNDEGAAGLAYEYVQLPSSRHKSLSGVYMIDTLGRKCENENGISGVVYEYDKKSGLIAEIRLVDKDGNVRENAQGVARIKTEWEGFRLLAYSYYGADANRKKEHKSAGVHRVAFIYNRRGECTAYYYYDVAGGMCVNKKLGAVGLVVKIEGNEETYTFIGPDGKARANGGFAIFKRKKDRMGRVVEESYCDETGNLCRIGIGISAVRYRYDSLGRNEYRAYFDADNKPCVSPFGYSYCTTEYEVLANGRERSTMKMFTPDGEPYVCFDGYSSVVSEYDGEGFSLDAYYYGEVPCINTREGCHAIRHERTTNGYTLVTLLNEQLQPMSKSIDGICSIITRKDRQGNFVESYLDHSGNPCPHQYGYFIRRYKMDEHDRLVAEYYLDEKERPCKSLAMGSYGKLYEFDDTQSLVRRIMVDAGGNPMMSDHGVCIVETREDNVTFTQEYRCFDINGQACINSAGYHRRVEKSDRKAQGERDISYYGVDDQPIVTVSGYQVCKERTYTLDGLKIGESVYDGVAGRLTYVIKEYEKDGWKYRERLVYDETGKPCLSRMGWHHSIIRTDESGNYEELFYGVDGTPVDSKWGYHKVERRVEQKRDRKITRYAFCDKSGTPCRAPRSEEHQLVITDDQEKKLTIYEFFDETGKPCCSWGGFARAEFSQDRRVFHDEQGRPCMSIFGYAEARMVTEGGKQKVLFYDERGELISPLSGGLVDGSKTIRTIPRDYLELSFDAEPECYVSPVILSSLTEIDSWAQISPWVGGMVAEISRGSDAYEGTKRFLLSDGTAVTPDIGYARIRRTVFNGEMLKSARDRGYFTDHYFDADGKRCVDAEGCYGRRVYLNENNRVTEEVYLAENGARCTDKTDGVVGKLFSYNELGLLTRVIMMDVDEGGGGSSSQGYVMKNHYYQWGDRCIETAFFSNDDIPCILRRDGVHKVRERFDERFRLVEQICYGTDDQECNNSYGYCRRLIEYTPEGAKVRYLDVEGRPVVPPGEVATR